MDEQRWRTAAWSAAGVIALLLAILCRRRRTGCDGSVGAWDDSPSWGGDGRMTNVDGFTTFVDDRSPCWRYDAISSALAVLGIDPGSDGPAGPVLLERAPSAGSGEVDITLTYEIEDDDSVVGRRYRFTFVDEVFTGGTAGIWRLLEGLREFRCQPGRGQTDWGTDLCL
jgi:hypothetical protein